MTNWTLETLEDFEGVFFDAGMGWKVLFEIHLAISLRHRYVSSGNANFNTQISGIIWTDDDATAEQGDLRTELEACYQAISAMMSGPQTQFGGHHWTHTSGRSPMWTLESMTADIGMGEFSDLLVRTQSPESLVWLIAALNRMQHLKLWRQLTFSDFSHRHNGVLVHDIPEGDLFLGSQTDVHDDPDERMQQAWVTSSGPSSSEIGALPPGAGWTMRAGGIGTFLARYSATRISASRNISLHPGSAVGSLLPPAPAPSQRRTELAVRCLDYAYNLIVFGYNGPDFVVKIGSAPETNIGHTHTGPSTLYLESEGPDLDFAGTDTVDLELMTSVPGTVPFDVFSSFDPQPRISVRVSSAWVYCDLPEIMGAGELTAPKPTVSATAEQEE